MKNVICILWSLLIFTVQHTCAMEKELTWGEQVARSCKPATPHAMVWLYLYPESSKHNWFFKGSSIMQVCRTLPIDTSLDEALALMADMVALYGFTKIEAIQLAACNKELCSWDALSYTGSLEDSEKKLSHWVLPENRIIFEAYAVKSSLPVPYSDGIPCTLY